MTAKDGDKGSSKERRAPIEPSDSENAPKGPKESNGRGGKRKGAGRKRGASHEVIVLGHFARAFRDGGLPDERVPGSAEDPRKRRRQLDYAEDQLPGPTRQERRAGRAEMARQWRRARAHGLAGASSREALLATIIGQSERVADEWLSAQARLNIPARPFAPLDELIEALHEELARARAHVRSLIADEWQRHVESDRREGEWLRQVRKVPPGA